VCCWLPEVHAAKDLRFSQGQCSANAENAKTPLVKTAKPTCQSILRPGAELIIQKSILAKAAQERVIGTVKSLKTPAYNNRYDSIPAIIKVAFGHGQNTTPIPRLFLPLGKRGGYAAYHYPLSASVFPSGKYTTQSHSHPQMPIKKKAIS